MVRDSSPEKPTLEFIIEDIWDSGPYHAKVLHSDYFTDMHEVL